MTRHLLHINFIKSKNTYFTDLTLITHMTSNNHLHKCYQPKKCTLYWYYSYYSYDASSTSTEMSKNAHITDLTRITHMTRQQLQNFCRNYKSYKM